MTSSPDLPRNLATVVLGGLIGSTLPSPKRNEAEPTYTGRVLVPEVRSILEQVGTRGLVVSGDGAGPVRSVSVLGRNYYPDLAISSATHQLLALEVKIVSRNGGQALATGLGQATLYLTRYDYAALLAVDVFGTVPQEDVDGLNALLDTPRLVVACVRTEVRGRS